MIIIQKNKNFNIDFSNSIKNSISESIKKHTVSDVPIAVMLSGGIDSSSIISHLIDLNKKFIAITVVFEEYQNTNMDELPFAKEIVKRKKLSIILEKFQKKSF